MMNDHRIGSSTDRLKSFPTNIHRHCLTCIRPRKCIRIPYAFNQATQLSMEEKYSMILDVNYHYQTDGQPQQQNEDQTLVTKIKTKVKNGEISDDSVILKKHKNEDTEAEFCPVVKCINDGCQMVMHYCKMKEHFLICQYELVSCINSHYGCPYTMLRGQIAAHLQDQCPANVVHCSAEWNRWPLHTTEKSPQSQVFCSPHSLNIHNLDVALALRDQRMLKQLWSASRQMKRIMRGCLSTHPAVPIKPYIGIRTFREFRTNTNVQQQQQNGTTNGTSTGTNNGHQHQHSSSSMSNCCDNNIDEEKYINYAARIVETAYRESLEEILRQTANYFRRVYYERTNDYRQQQLRKKSNSICCQMVVASNNTSSSLSSNNMTNGDQNEGEQFENLNHPNNHSHNLLPLVPLSSDQCSLFPSSTSINLPIITDADKLLYAEMCGKNKTQTSSTNANIQGNSSDQMIQAPVPPPVPKCNTLSLEISIRSYAFHHPKPRAMYTFRCGMDFRKDELASHSRDIHSDIHGGLDGWIEHRCPLFQYGCTFVHRRLSPVLSGKSSYNNKELSTIVYNESLETFACCTISSDDWIHQQQDHNHHQRQPNHGSQSSISLMIDDDEEDEDDCGSATSSSSSITSSITGTEQQQPQSSNQQHHHKHNIQLSNNNHNNQSSTSYPLSTSSSSYSLLSNNSSAPLLLSSTSSSSELAGIYQNNVYYPSRMVNHVQNEYDTLPQHQQSQPQRSPSEHLPSMMAVISPSLSQMPFEILQNICQYLDGFSLNNLSFTSKQMRSVVQTFVKRKGYVVLQWKRFELEKGKYRWRVVYRKWLFSTAMQPIKGWQLDSDNVMARHLQLCQFYDRVVHKERFSLYPKISTNGNGNDEDDDNGQKQQSQQQQPLQIIAPWTAKLVFKNNHGTTMMADSPSNNDKTP